MTFTADYAPAIVFPAHPTNIIGPPCTPKGWVLHTPEEPADGYPGTPHWFAQDHGDPDKAGSTHYFVAYTGDVYQCVPESSAAIANGVLGKPYPSWANPAQSLNRQTVNVEIEGYAANIEDTLLVGSVQWGALVDLVRDRAKHYGFPPDRDHVIGHYQVATDRTDPGAGFPWDALIAALNEQEDEDMATPFLVWCDAEKAAYIVGPTGAKPIYDRKDYNAFAAAYGPPKLSLTPAGVKALA